MQVTLLSHLFPNSIDPLLGVFVSEKARALSKYVDLKVIAPVSYFPFFRINIPQVDEIFCDLKVQHPRFLALPFLLWGIRWIPYYFALKAIWGSQKPISDILLIEWIYPDAYAALKYIHKFNVKAVAVIHGNEAIGILEKPYRRKKYIEALKGFDKIIAVSVDLKNKMINEYGIFEDRIVVIHNGVTLDKFPIINQHNARHELGLPMEHKIGLCVARLSQEKNLEVLIEAVSKIHNTKFKMFIIGDGPLRSKLESLIDHLKVKDQIKLVGPVSHNKVYLWLNAADFFCLPSQREGCPVVIHEALACGLPIISTTVGAIPDLINKEEYGLLCPHSDDSALSDILQRAMKATWNRDTIAKYGRQFTWDAVALQTEQVLREVIH